MESSLLEACAYALGAPAGAACLLLGLWRVEEVILGPSTQRDNAPDTTPDRPPRGPGPG